MTCWREEFGTRHSYRLILSQPREGRLGRHEHVQAFVSVPGYLKNLSVNRPDCIIRLVTTYLRLVGLVHSRFIEAPGLRISTLRIERGTLNGFYCCRAIIIQNLIAPRLWR
jgi:hypothetical protein